MHVPKISVITINKNSASFLIETIESVLSQTMNDYEHIIIDSASSALKYHSSVQEKVYQ